AETFPPDVPQLVLVEADQDHGPRQQGEEQRMQAEEDRVRTELELKGEVLLQSVEERSPGEQRLTRLADEEPPAEREMGGYERRIEARRSAHEADRLRLLVRVPGHQATAVGEPCLAGHGRLLRLSLLLEPLVELAHVRKRALV